MRTEAACSSRPRKAGSPPTHYRTDPKQAAIDQWTADPCEAVTGAGTPGARDYFLEVLAKRERYLRDGADPTWMAEVLDYRSAAGLEVLDVGCGQGLDLYRYASVGARVTGVDLTPRHVELATAHLSAMGAEAIVVRGDAEQLPFAPGTFDRVSSNGVLHHTPDMPAALEEMRRVLKPGGRATVIVYHRDSLYFWLSIVLRQGVIGGRFRRQRLGDILSEQVEHSTVDARPLVRVYSRGQLRRLMEAAGFTDVEVKVRHSSDAFLARRLTSARLHRVLGRIAGWYVIAGGRA